MVVFELHWNITDDYPLWFQGTRFTTRGVVQCPRIQWIVHGKRLQCLT